MKPTNIIVSISFLSAVTCAPIPVRRSLEGKWNRISSLVTYNEIIEPPDLSARQPISLKREDSSPYWYQQIPHQGISAFGTPDYQVYRSVTTFGAKGDGKTDDTAAIQAAISAGGRCGQNCDSSTTTPAVVYFPAGEYPVSSSILVDYYTQIIGNPNNLPILKATPNFQGNGIINGNWNKPQGDMNWISQNIFFRQIKNFVLDMRAVDSSKDMVGIHWPTSQATSLQNLRFEMNAAPRIQHVGLLSEDGSAGFMSDLTFNGGLIGAKLGNQQFTIRNVTFNGCVTAIEQLWNWGFTYQGISINNCQKGFDLTTNGTSKAGSVVILDTSITNTPIGIISSYDPAGQVTVGSLILENIQLNNVPIAIQDYNSSSTLLPGTTCITIIQAWGQGHQDIPNSPHTFQGPMTPNTRPASLLNPDAKFYTQSKPRYESEPLSSFLSVRAAGARGDGKTDDTTALQTIINTAAKEGKIVFFDAGTYLITTTLHIPPGSRIIGETYPVILSSGPFFNDIQNPKPVIQVGNPGDTGHVEWGDMIVSTQGTQAGAILIEWNLSSPAASPSGIWDVHTRIGGFTGSQLTVNECPKSPGNGDVNAKCIAAYMSMHITPSASGLYLENNWFWTADHDIDAPGNPQISVYAGRGVLVESQEGNIWLVGTGSEHHTLYQFQLYATKNIYAGYIQSETPYYQPLPAAPSPFPPSPTGTALHGPIFTPAQTEAWGLRVVDSQDVLVYGAGFYSFFKNYDNDQCPKDEVCQNGILSLEGTNKRVGIYGLNEVGVEDLVWEDGMGGEPIDGDRGVSIADTVAVLRQG